VAGLGKGGQSVFEKALYPGCGIDCPALGVSHMTGTASCHRTAAQQKTRVVLLPPTHTLL